MANDLTVVQQKAVNLRDFLQGDRIKRQIEVALPKWLSAERMLRIVFSATLKNPTILECSTESILAAIMQACQLGLEPVLGRGYLIPYQNSKKVGNDWVKVYELSFQPGYQGLVDLARRSGDIRDVFAAIVYEQDEFEYQLGTEKHITHKPFLSGDPGKMIGTYCVWELKDGVKHFDFMTLSEVYKRREKSQAYRYAIENPNNKKAQECPWIAWPEEQIKKTVIKYSSKLMPASIEFMEAVQLDNAHETGTATQIGSSVFTQALPEAQGQAQITSNEPVSKTAKIDAAIADDAEINTFIQEKVIQWAMDEKAIREAAEEHFEDFKIKLSAWKEKRKSQPEPTKQKRTRGPKKEPAPAPVQPELPLQTNGTEKGLEQTEDWESLMELQRNNKEIYAAAKIKLNLPQGPRTVPEVRAIIAEMESQLMPWEGKEGPPEG
jgi:recombination protein RecT